MKKLLLMLLLSGCASERTVYVWNMKDVIGFWFIGICLFAMSIIYLVMWIQYKIEKRKQKRKNKQT